MTYTNSDNIDLLELNDEIHFISNNVIRKYKVKVGIDDGEFCINYEHTTADRDIMELIGTIDKKLSGKTLTGLAEQAYFLEKYNCLQFYGAVISDSLENLKTLTNELFRIFNNKSD